MSATNVFRPGRRRVTPADLFEIASAEAIVSEWQTAMERIDEAERAAESEDATIRIR